MEHCLEGPHLGNHETKLQTRKSRTHEQSYAITFMGLRRRVRMEECLEGPHNNVHGVPKKGENGGLL